MAKKKLVLNDYFYVIAPLEETTPFRDLQKAIEQAKVWVAERDDDAPFQVLKVSQSWVVELPETPDPIVLEESEEDRWFYDK